MILQIRDQTFPVPATPHPKLEPGHLLLGLPEQQLLGLLGLPLLPQCLLRLSLTLRLLVTIYCLKESDSVHNSDFDEDDEDVFEERRVDQQQVGGWATTPMGDT